MCSNPKIDPVVMGNKEGSHKKERSVCVQRPSLHNSRLACGWVDRQGGLFAPPRSLSLPAEETGNDNTHDNHMMRTSTATTGTQFTPPPDGGGGEGRARRSVEGGEDM